MRNPVVAGRFYPAQKEELLATIESYMQEVAPQPPAIATAVIAPHAGYIYSGRLAAQTLGSVSIPETVLLLGPNHTGHGQSASVSEQDWSTPLGNIPVNQLLTHSIITANDMFVIDETAHQFEHSLEVQLPFLQYLQSQLSIAVITLKQMSYDKCEKLATSLSCALQEYNKPVLILASTDMSHYESRPNATTKDALAISAITEMDPLHLFTTVQENNISMCGVIPVVITLLLSNKLGAKNARMIGYMDSGDVSKETKQVVGYAGVIIE